MTSYVKPEADWPQVFPPEEFASRREKVAQALEAAGLDALLVTSPPDIHYLTGYDMIWFHLRSLTSCLLIADSRETIFFDHDGHATIVHTTPQIERIEWIARNSVEEASATIASALVKSGLKDKSVAVQRWSYAPHADVLDQLSEDLRAAGMTVRDASRLIEDVRLIKSPLEVACMRRAAAIADDAMSAARDMIAPDVMETALQGAIMQSMMQAGGGDPSIRCMIGSGVRSGTHHSPAQHRTIRDGELIFIDFCSSLHRYHVNLNRTFALGDVDPRWFELLERAAVIIDKIVDTIEPGDDWSKIQDVADKVAGDERLQENAWYIGGYSLGISMPPDWVGEHRVRPRGDIEDRKLEPGLVFNFEAQFDVWQGWTGGTGAAYIETFLMTEDGLEVLSRLPRTLVTVGS